MLSEQQLVDLFSTQQNWQDRYRQLIVLSRDLPLFPDNKKTEENQVKGCENRVWLIVQKQSDNRFEFQGESDGRIVKGLLAILLILVNGKTKEEIEVIDFQAKLHTLHLIGELSSSRQLGLFALVARIKQLCSSQ